MFQGGVIYKVFEHKKFSHSVTNPIGVDGKFVQTAELFLPTTVVHWLVKFQAELKDILFSMQWIAEYPAEFIGVLTWEQAFTDAE